MKQRESIGESSGGEMRDKGRHIDDVQTKTVDEHFEMLMGNNNTAIDSEFSDVEPKDLPGWYDEALFKAGQKYYQRNLLAMGLTSLIGLLAVIVIPSILKILVFTKQSGTVCMAYKRYLQTVLHIHTLYTTDIKDKNSNWWKSINTIRWKHATNSRRSRNSGNAPITQGDMALTQFGFIGYALVCPWQLSLTNEPEGREGLNHFWRVVGHALGISDRMNICRKNASETTQLCKRLLSEVYVEHMKNSPPNFAHMSTVLIDGLWSIDVTLDVDAFMYLWYELSGLEYSKPTSTYTWLNIRYRNFVLYLIRTPFVGYFVRNGFNIYLTINNWLVQNFPVIAWMRYGVAQSAINLYPKLTKACKGQN